MRTSRPWLRGGSDLILDRRLTRTCMSSIVGHHPRALRPRRSGWVLIPLERPGAHAMVEADHRTSAPGLRSQNSRFMRAFSGWVSRSSGTKKRVPIQAGRWPVSQRYSGRKDLRVPADSVTRTYQEPSPGAPLGESVREEGFTAPILRTRSPRPLVQGRSSGGEA